MSKHSVFISFIVVTEVSSSSLIMQINHLLNHTKECSSFSCCLEKKTHILDNWIPDERRPKRRLRMTSYSTETINSGNRKYLSHHAFGSLLFMIKSVGNHVAS